MIHSLTYEAEFPPSMIHPTGRKLKGNIKLGKGLTLVTGANEAGKSFSQEMIRFCLFGAAALRGKATDYTKVDAAMEFDIRKDRYSVERTLRKAILKRGVEIIATGVSPVNEKLVGLMGFGLDVFDVACSANQDDLLRITSMKPTERRRLVDTVVGIGALEVVGKWASMEASLRERDAKTMRAVLTAPVRPVAPTLSLSPDETRRALAAAEAAHSELQQVNGWLSQTRNKPTAPHTDVPIPSENLKGFAEDRKKLRLEIETLKARIRVLPEREPVITVTREQIAAWEAYRDARARLSYNIKPHMPLEEIQLWLKQWEAHHRYNTVKAKNDTIWARIFELETYKNHCPACNHEWLANEGLLNDLRTDVVDTDPVDRPPHSTADLRSAEQQWSKFNEDAYDRDLAVPEAPNPGLTLAQLEAGEKEAALAAERKRLTPELAALETKFAAGKDWEGMLSQRLAYEASLTRYHEDLRVFQEWEKQRIEMVGRQLTLKPIADQLAALRLEAEALRIYERDMQRYEIEAATYLKQMDVVADLEARAVQYRLVAEAMTRIRGKVKQFLLPSLNRVASALLSRLTGGARTSIIIDDEFEILVDGQRVDTLSGSGKACANLAIRIALGQVLVSGVMSIFLGDEIDGSMDSFRAEETTLTLRDLVKSVSQIVIVSHKNLEADHTVVIGV